MFPICFFGDAGLAEICCAHSPVAMKLVSHTPCDIYAHDPQRARGRELLDVSMDIGSLCNIALASVSPRRPSSLVVVSMEQVHFFRNYVAHLDVLPDWLPHVLVINLDVPSLEVCEELAQATSQRTYKMFCASPRRCFSEAGAPLDRCPDRPVPADRVQRLSSGGFVDHVANWFKPAVTQLLLDLGAVGVLYSDLDVLFLSGSPDFYLSPVSSRLQVMCETTILPGNPRKFFMQGGIVFAPRLAQELVDRWVASLNETYLWVHELAAMRERYDEYVCLSISAFLNVDGFLTPDGAQVAVHFSGVEPAMKPELMKLYNLWRVSGVSDYPDASQSPISLNRAVSPQEAWSVINEDRKMRGLL
mmetsp:Transcript_58156/g.188215  ORF Transcript_58156/g.188215 Transcript_58156/m.188215 type:complete len:360 (-) Transcript_58156:152-1231(-)